MSSWDVIGYRRKRKHHDLFVEECTKQWRPKTLQRPDTSTQFLFKPGNLLSDLRNISENAFTIAFNSAEPSPNLNKNVLHWAVWIQCCYAITYYFGRWCRLDLINCNWSLMLGSTHILSFIDIYIFGNFVNCYCH